MSKRITKFDKGTKITQMARADGYVMCRRPHCIPFVMHVDDFDALPNYSPKAEARYQAIKAEYQAMARMPVKGY